MYPRLFTLPSFDVIGRHIGPLTLHSYGVLLALAFLAGLWVVSREAKKAGLDATVITDMAVYVLIGGLVGAKLLLLLVEWSYYSKHPGEILGLLQAEACSTAVSSARSPSRGGSRAGIASMPGRRPTCSRPAWPSARPSGGWDASPPAAATAGPPTCRGR